MKIALPSFLRRGLGLVIILAGLSWPILRGAAEVRREHRMRVLLLEVQRALQDFHVDQERYIPRQSLNGTEILGVLVDFGFLEELPLNPWSGEVWKLDGEEPDHLRYETDPNFETYALRALDPESGEVLLEIDSVEHPSLE